MNRVTWSVLEASMVASVTTCVNSVTRSVSAFDGDVNVIANVKLNVSVEDTD